MKKNKNSYKKSGVDISLANKLLNIYQNYHKKMSKNQNLYQKKDIIGGFGSCLT